MGNLGCGTNSMLVKILECLTYAQVMKIVTIRAKEWINFVRDVGKGAKRK